ncbi:MAG: S9 family peptidase, partial [Candidatus Heimdallarchaeaceae archaeon]
MVLKEISIEDLYLLKEIKKVQILPGKKYLFEEQKLNKKENKYNSAIYLQGDEDTKPKQFTSGQSQDQSMELSPNKESIAFLSQRGGEKEKPQLYIMAVTGGESIKYTTMPNGVNSFKWSLDGKKVIFSHRVSIEEQSDEDKALEEKDKPQELSEIDQKVKKLKQEETEKKKVDPRVVQKIVYRKGTSFMDDKINHYYVLDIETKETRRITSGGFNYISAVLSKDNSKVYAAKQKEDGPLNDLYEFLIEEISIETNEVKELKTALGFGTNLSISVNGVWLVYDTILTIEEASTQNAEIKLLKIDSGLEKLVTESIDNHAFSASFDSKTDYLYFVVDDWEKNILYRYSIERDTLEKVVFGDYLIFSYDVDADQGLILLNISTSKEPSKLMSYDYVYKVTKPLWESNKNWLKERNLAITDETKYSGDKKEEIQGWIVKPPKFDANNKYPLILEIHGGPHSTWSPHERSMWFEF